MAPGEPLQVEVVCCAQAGPCQSVPLQLAPGATVADALRLSGLLEQHGLGADTVKAGVWGRVREGHTLLRDRDRVEQHVDAGTGCMGPLRQQATKLPAAGLTPIQAQQMPRDVLQRRARGQLAFHIRAIGL